MTTTHKIAAKGAELFATDTGNGPAVVFAHSLGLNHHVWDGVVDRLPNHRCIRYDLRGHGQSDAPPGPYSMGALIADAEAICDTLALKDVVFVGLSVGGLIAQGLAVKRLDVVRAVVLSGTAAKFGQPEPWHARAKIARTDGMGALVEATLTRWNAGDDSLKLKESLLAANPEGFAATCEAIAGTDFYTPTSALRLPTLGLCGTNDKATPPDLVRETTDLIRGSSFALIRKAGHIAPLTHPDEVTIHLTAFLAGIGHV